MSKKDSLHEVDLNMDGKVMLLPDPYVIDQISYPIYRVMWVSHCYNLQMYFSLDRAITITVSK